MSDAFRIQNAILCEEVRVEKNDKLILLGVYPGDVLIHDIPGALRMTFYLELADLKKGQHAIFIRISGPGKGFAEATAEVNVGDNTDVVSLTGPSAILKVEQEGTLVLELGLSQDEMRPVWKRKVRLMSDS